MEVSLQNVQTVNEILKVMFINSTLVSDDGTGMIPDMTSRDWNFYNGMCEVLAVLGVPLDQNNGNGPIQVVYTPDLSNPIDYEITTTPKTQQNEGKES